MDTEIRAKRPHGNLEIAAELGFTDDAALADARRFAKLTPDTRQRILAEHKIPSDLPTGEPSDPDRRAELVRKEACNAPRRKKKKRPRSVSKNRDAVKRERTDPYLRDLYTNRDHETICQVCQDHLPFKLSNGSYYFEAVEFLPELERHHRQNYLALCPNHAAMFKHANASKEQLKDLFLGLDGNELRITLADRMVAVYFTNTHIADLKVVIGVDDES